MNSGKSDHEISVKDIVINPFKTVTVLACENEEQRYFIRDGVIM